MIPTNAKIYLSMYRFIIFQVIQQNKSNKFECLN